MYITETNGAIATTLNCDPISYEQLVADICPKTLNQLRKELELLLSAIDNAERFYCEGSSECVDAEELVLIRANQVKKSIRNLAIDFGIHASFLAEYSERVEFTAA